MALKRLVIDGYGQIELNRVAFPVDGRIEAQCELDPTDFATVPAENGMLLSVDKLAKTIKFVDTDELFPVALHYSTEHIYDERTPGLKNFNLPRGGFYPRMGYISVGDLYTTNCISYDDTEFATEALFKTALGAIATTPLYGGVGTDGSTLISATAPTDGPILLVTKKTTMPDGQLGVKLQVAKV